MTLLAAPPVDLSPRLASADMDDFSVPTGREEEWRFAPVSELAAFMQPDPSAGTLTAALSSHVTVVAAADAAGSDTPITRLSDQTPTIVSAAGDTRVTPNHFKFQVDRSTYNAGLRARLETGPVRHAISFMGTLYSDRNAQASVNGTPLSSNIYHPVTRPRQDIAAPASVRRTGPAPLIAARPAQTGRPARPSPRPAPR